MIIGESLNVFPTGDSVLLESGTDFERFVFIDKAILPELIMVLTKECVATQSVCPESGGVCCG